MAAREEEAREEEAAEEVEATRAANCSTSRWCLRSLERSASGAERVSEGAGG